MLLTAHLTAGRGQVGQQLVVHVEGAQWAAGGGHAHRGAAPPDVVPGPPAGLLGLLDQSEVSIVVT